jgi:predicted ATPase
VDRPLMVIAFARPGVDDRFPRLWADRDLQRMALVPLSSKSAQKLAEHILGTDVPPERLAWIVERAEGNPFHLEELARAVAESGESGSSAGLKLPQTVLGMVQARFDVLGPDAKRVIRTASVFGLAFRPAGVRALLDDLADDIDRWLDILTKREVVYSRDAGTGLEYLFRHAVVHEAAYEMLTPDDRRLAHRSAGDFLEKSGERDAIVLVEHFERGGEFQRAAQWIEPAAAQALEASDLAAVIERVARGIKLGAEGETLGALRLAEAQARFWGGEYRLAEAAAREALAKTRPSDRLRALEELVAAIGQQARFPEVEDLTRAIQAFESSPETRQARLCSLLRAAGYLVSGGSYHAGRAIVAEVQREPHLDPILRGHAHRLQGLLATVDGNRAAAMEAFRLASGCFQSAGDVRSATEMETNIGTSLCDLGALQTGEEHLRTALATAERIELSYITAGVLTNLVLAVGYQGRVAEARVLAE